MEEFRTECDSGNPFVGQIPSAMLRTSSSLTLRMTGCADAFHC